MLKNITMSAGMVLVFALVSAVPYTLRFYSEGNETYSRWECQFLLALYRNLSICIVGAIAALTFFYCLVLCFLTVALCIHRSRIPKDSRINRQYYIDRLAENVSLGKSVAGQY